MALPPIPERSSRPTRVVDPVFIWPVPEKADYLFWVEVDMKLPAYASYTYGTAHPDATSYPNHKLVYVSPQDANNISRWFYASNRTNEVNYNWTLVNNNTVQRTYLVLRTNYPGTVPAVGTADTKFADYVFAGESVSRTDTELDSLYVLVTRIYSIETLVSYQWDDALERNIKITRTIIPAGTETGSQADGVLVEIRAGDTFYDVRLTSEVVWLAADLVGGDSPTTPTFPIELTAVATDANYPFPPRLDSLDVYGAWAFAGNNASADSYSEDFFFEVNITEPMPGPYDAKLRRFLTDDPDAVRILHPTAKITRKAETIGVIRSWSSASGTKGNRTFSQARQHNIPSTVHDEVALPTGVNYAQGANGTGDTATGYGAASLPATPGYATYAATTTTVAGVTTRRAKFGLYEVQVVEIQKGGSNVYS